MKLSVLIPVFNEEDSVEALIRRVAAIDLPIEIIVVDDASTDASRTRLDSLDIPGLRVIHHAENRGKGAAVRTAIAAATGDAMVIQDADLEYFPEDYPVLLAPMLEGRADVVYGVRDLSGQPFVRRFGNRFLTQATNLLFNSRLHDMETCYKLMRADVARSLVLTSERFEIEPEITVRLLQGGHRIHEVPIRYAPRRVRKLRPWRDGPHALWTLLRFKLQR